MEFCGNCKNYLFLKEEKTNDKRVLFYICKKCDFKKECLNKKISFKTYRNTDIVINDTYLNKYKVTDPTLPTKLSKCCKCKKTNMNTYEVKYFNNSYNLNMICKSCFHSWIF